MGSQLTVEELAEQAKSHAARLRDERRNAASTRFRSTVAAPRGFTGPAFVEADGLLLEFLDGLETENIYTAAGAEMRDHALDADGGDRQRCYTDLLGVLRTGATALNVGCGNDIVIERACAAAGIHVMHTDASTDVVSRFSKQVGGRAFAVNLADLDRVLPESCVDVVLGNSVMGYVSPARIRAVVAQLARVARHGAIFTFDLTPHGCYFDIFDRTVTRTVINSSAGDPAKLIELLRKYGPKKGPGAFWYYYGLRNVAVQLGLLGFLERLLVDLDFRVTLSRSSFEVSGGGSQFVWVLRAYRTPSDLGAHVCSRAEEPFKLDDEYWRRQVSRDDVRVPFYYIDREQASVVAKLVNLDCTRRQAPWWVLDFMGQEHDLEDDVAEELARRVSPFAAMRQFEETASPHYTPSIDRMPEAVYQDQFLRSVFLREYFAGNIDVDFEEGVSRTDARIDNAYEDAAQKRRQAEQQRLERSRKAERRKKEKSRKKQRRKNRRRQ